MIRLPGQTCPACAHRLDAMDVMGDETATPPLPGDFSVCLNCEQILRFDANLKLEVALWKDLPKENKAEVMRIIVAIRATRPMWQGRLN